MSTERPFAPPDNSEDVAPDEDFELGEDELNFEDDFAEDDWADSDLEEDEDEFEEDLY